MKFYFSGITGKSEMAMLKEAEVSHVLVDPFQFRHLSGYEGNVALDCGAYAAWKQKRYWNVDRYEQFLLATVMQFQFDFLTSLDVIDDPVASMINYRTLVERGHQVMPVWHWGEDEKYLNTYLDESEIVGIGGLVLSLREKNKNVLQELADLCFEYPGRFHLFGCCWPKAIDWLNPYVHSADSSVWLRGAKYAAAIFKHTRNGHLLQAPAKLIPDYKDLDRQGRCVQNAKEIEAFCNKRA